jgi:hypothetical protein
VVHLAAGEGVAGDPCLDRGVRDEQRQRLGDVRAVTLVRLREIVPGEDGDQPIDVQGVGDVDVEHPGMRVRAADERHRQRVVTQVVEVAATAGQQPLVLAPDDAGPDEARPDQARPVAGGLAHGRASPVISRDSSAARSTDATMFW